MPTTQQPAPIVHDLPETELYQSHFGRTTTPFGSAWWESMGFIHLVFIIAVLAVSTYTKVMGGGYPGVNEWDACDRQLGMWACLWVGTIFLTCGMSYLGWIRDWAACVATADRTNAARPTPAAAPVMPPNSRVVPRGGAIEVTTPTNNQAAVTLPHSHLYARPSLLSPLVTTAHTPLYTSFNTCCKLLPHLLGLIFSIVSFIVLEGLGPFILLLVGYLAFMSVLRPHFERNGTSAHRSIGYIEPPFPLQPMSRDAPRGGAIEVTTHANNQAAMTLPHSHLYARLSLLSPFATTAHTPLYTSSFNTCRKLLPHLLGLIFGIVSFIVLEGLGSFILLLVGYFAFMSVLRPHFERNGTSAHHQLGHIEPSFPRQPVQNPHTIKPIRKLPKSIVESIPLVVYIPPPPDETEYVDSPKVPEAVCSNMTYSPDPKAVPNRWFAFLKKLKKNGKGDNGEKASSGKQAGKGEGAEDNGKPLTWEDNWEAGEYPFMRLEGNRAACAICLMDFEEPVKRGGLPSTKEKEATRAVADGPAQGVPVGEERVQEENRDGDGLQLEDAGQGAQPLRLLACGHVFHKTCVDPWLVDVSMRCPVCRQPVEMPVA